MTALVIGISGQIGSRLAALLRVSGHTVWGTFHRHPVPGETPLTLDDPAAARALLAERRPDWVIYAAGLNNLDRCEANPDEALRLNAACPTALAAEAATSGAGFVYYSSESVFDGQTGPWSEDDQPAPPGAYGRSKRSGEVGVIAANPRSLILRTSVVYGPDRQERNFVYRVIRTLGTGAELPVPYDQVSTPTYNDDTASATYELMNSESTGLFHVAGPDLIDRFSFAVAVCQEFGLDAERLRSVPSERLQQHGPRPRRGGLRSTRIRGSLQTPFRGVREGLASMSREDVTARG